MDSGLPFPIEIVFLLLVLPIGFAYLISVAGVGLMCLRRAARRILDLFPAHPRPPAA